MCSKKLFCLFLVLLYSGCNEANSKNIEFYLTSKPMYPNFSNEEVKGKVKGVDFNQYYILVFSRVGDNFWTKPYLNNPKINIDSDGSWSCNIVTGNNDTYATEIGAHLIPIDIAPKICNPCPKFPEITESVAKILPTKLNGIPESKFISFAGYNWMIKRKDFKYGPGPNLFSDDIENVWVDKENNLHLTIQEKKNKWLCTEIINKQSLGYGLYAVSTKGRVDLLDKNTILGLFTWDNNSPEDNYKEIDVELAKWGNEYDSTNAQYVVQPDNPDHLKRFNVDLSGKDIQDQELTFFIYWQPGKVQFSTYTGTIESLGSVINKWEYNGDDVPVPGNEQFRFNLWLMNGAPPLKNQEVIITDFKWFNVDSIISEQTFIKTNLSVFPIMRYIEGETATINNNEIEIDKYDGISHYVNLTSGINIFNIQTFNKDHDITKKEKIIIDNDQDFSTQNHDLLYYYGDGQDTIIIDLTTEQILGVIQNVKIVSSSDFIPYVIDTKGNFYHISNHTKKLHLPFTKSEVYPIFTNGFVYAANEKIDLNSFSIIKSDLPFHIDFRFASVNKNLINIGTKNAIITVDTNNDEIISNVSFSKSSVYFGGSNVSKNQNYALVSSYSWASSSIDIINLKTNKKSSIKGLSDYAGQISFLNDSIALCSFYGNSYYGKGGLEVVNTNKLERISSYRQFGCSSVVVSNKDDLIYITTRYVDHFENGYYTQGDKSKRGIDVLKLSNNNILEHKKSYFLALPHKYQTSPNFFIKTSDSLDHKLKNNIEDKFQQSFRKDSIASRHVNPENNNSGSFRPSNFYYHMSPKNSDTEGFSVNSIENKLLIKKNNTLPEIYCEYVPPIGNRLKNLIVRVINANSKIKYQMLVYIYVDKFGWRLKTKKENCFINIEGNNVFDITSQAYDHLASKIQLYLFEHNVPSIFLLENNKIPRLISDSAISELEIQR
ncbi:conserved hypothetical protein, secreted [Candidatus Magnetomorum sp. HK-1]|nr:conserved hypothetical protein, secreted [Candidatus Magnetomorum sp. HK-1]